MEREGLVEFPKVLGEKIHMINVKMLLDGIDLAGMGPAANGRWWQTESSGYSIVTRIEMRSCGMNWQRT
jgi:hypothetical protein